ncbi:protein DEHYDRATION-INDUCED 19-like isoform X1 [Benincasa hispida]|uniref:protein DEHYDRATION-INDUCED 19-like isoform X1 n=1 Tax=Benincasa hispida TaxID=102211 RepID=UPI001900D0E5|nr:protein DEHYDRATION-INDUCED 19-like isoform X1 [Benincasa hispida]XP_038882146.1 protein DEHYDRATION-INDUCED 19-like isoform X1 [Benincasa hispida]XP_038882148.1 protein DEHYDRATION-INDUCED 19-like isoform X1 [Benincasa hispida]
MDSDFWTSRLAAAKRQYMLQHHHQTSNLDLLGIDDLEMDDDARPHFPCPFCYENFDVMSLCSHLEDEHSCETRVTVCPICSVKVMGDMLSHITLHHGHLYKLQRRRRLRKIAIPNSQALSLLSRDLREAHLQVLLGSSGYRTSTTNVPSATHDPFLSSLILNYPASEVEDISKSMLTSADDTSSENVLPSPIWKSSPSNSVGLYNYSSLVTSFDPSLSQEEREKRMRQAIGRAGFMRDMLFSTLLED